MTSAQVPPRAANRYSRAIQLSRTTLVSESTDFCYRLRSRLVILATVALVVVNFKKLFIYLVLVVLGLCCCIGYWLQYAGFSLWWLLLLWSTGMGHGGFSSWVHGLSSCTSQALEHSLNSCGPGDLVAPQHVRYSWIRDQTCVSFFGRQILYH